MRIVPLFCVFAVLVGCGGDGESTSAGARPGTGGPGHGGSARPPVPVAVDEATVGSIASYYRATASLEAEKSAEVLARAAGLVAEVLAEEGDRVPAGGALLRIRNGEYGYRLEQAEARTAQLRAAFERLEQMRVEELASEAEYESARADLASAEADEGLARLNLSYTTVTAPFAGVVTQRLVDPGENVSLGTAVYTLVDVDPLLARVHVPSREFRQLQLDQAVQLRLDSTRAQLTGRIKLISPVIDPASGTIKVTVEVSDYPAGTRPGDFAEVRIVTELRPAALLVPRTAVVTEKGETVVYVAVGVEKVKAERRLVEVGFTDEDRAEILSGVTAGERLVVKGQRSLKDGQPLHILEGPGAEKPADEQRHQDGRDA